MLAPESEPGAHTRSDDDRRGERDLDLEIDREGEREEYDRLREE